jgi:4-hydroxy-tetrahydrodipicolinate reductase
LANDEATGMLTYFNFLKRKIMTKIAVIGAAGRMGSTIIRTIDQDSAVSLGCALERPGSTVLGQDAGLLANVGQLGIAIVDSPRGCSFDMMIDFSTPASTLHNIEFCQKEGRAMVIGTTGMNDDALDILRWASEHIPIMFSANYSVGVNLAAKLLKMAAAVIGNETDIEVIEAHHKHKVDAPSGTALLLGRAIADELGKDLGRDGVFCREGIIGEREQGSIGFSTIRGGDIAGEHTVMFIGESERLEITHRATDRKIFANGAIKAAKWLSDKPAGLYGMDDVLGLNQ